MSIVKPLLTGVVATVLAGAVAAAEPTRLADAQLDDVAAGATIVGAIALTGPTATVNFQSFSFAELSRTATVDRVAVGADAFQSRLLQTQTAVGSSGFVPNSGGGALVPSGGLLSTGLPVPMLAFPPLP